MKQARRETDFNDRNRACTPGMRPRAKQFHPLPDNDQREAGAVLRRDVHPPLASELATTWFEDRAQLKVQRPAPSKDREREER